MYTADVYQSGSMCNLTILVTQNHKVAEECSTTINLFWSEELAGPRVAHIPRVVARFQFLQQHIGLFRFLWIHRSVAVNLVELPDISQASGGALYVPGVWVPGP